MRIFMFPVLDLAWIIGSFCLVIEFMRRLLSVLLRDAKASNVSPFACLRQVVGNSPGSVDSISIIDKRWESHVRGAF